MEIKRFSESSLWQLQHLAYTQFGPQAWASKGVPFYLTSNPLIAKQFADVIREYLGSDSGTIYDLGAGSGRLAYLMLKELEDTKIKYIMTDISAENIAFWQQHEYLKKYADHLDFMQFQHDQKEVPQVEGPVILVCTYFFDTIPQDLFKVEGGKLLEGKIALDIPEGRLRPEWIENIQGSYSYEPIEGEYYDNPLWNQLLNEYRKEFEGSTFLFPTGALQVIDTFKNNPLLILAGDQGVATHSQIREWGEPKISKHASFSIAVSYHAIKRYLELHGGGATLPAHPNTKFIVMNGWVGKEPPIKSTDQMQPVEYLEKTSLSDEQLKALLLQEIFDLIELGNYDPINFYVYYPHIREKIHELKPEMVKAFIAKVYENFYPVSTDEGDFVLNLGVLLYDIGEYKDALPYMHKALSIKGQSNLIFYNIAETYRKMKEESAGQ